MSSYCSVTDRFKKFTKDLKTNIRWQFIFLRINGALHLKSYWKTSFWTEKVPQKLSCMLHGGGFSPVLTLRRFSSFREFSFRSYLRNSVFWPNQSSKPILKFFQQIFFCQNVNFLTRFCVRIRRPSNRTRLMWVLKSFPARSCSKFVWVIISINSHLALQRKKDSKLNFELQC